MPYAEETMNKKMVWIYAVILAALAIVLPLFNIPLEVGNPNLGSLPVTLAAVWLPWPFCIVIALIKGISASLITGRLWIEVPAGIGDALMAILTFWLARHMHRALAAVLGQLSRLILTSGMIAIVISAAFALNLLSPGLSPIPGLTSSFWADLGTSWLAITTWSIVLSAAVNGILALVIVLLCTRPVENSLKK